MNKRTWIAVLACAASVTAFSGSVLAEETRPEYHALDYVTLGEYKGLRVYDISVEPSDEDVEAAIREHIYEAGQMAEITDGTAEEGDILNIDFSGTMDGGAFPGSTAQSFVLELGSDTFIEGFEEGLIGASAGDTITMSLTYPERYFNKEMAGKEAEFSVTVNSVKRTPELTDELAGKVSGGACSSAADYRSTILAELTEDADYQRELNLKKKLLTKVANASEIKSFPQDLLTYCEARMNAYYQSCAEECMMDYTSFVSLYMGMTDEQLHAEIQQAVEQNLQQEMYLLAIAETENLTVSEEEIAASAAEYAADYGYESVEELNQAYGQDNVRISALQNKVLDFLLEQAEII